MKDRLTQLGEFFVSQGSLSQREWVMLQGVLLLTLQQYSKRLDLTNPNQLSKIIVAQLHRRTLSGWLQGGGNDIDPALARKFSRQNLIKYGFFPCKFNSEGNLVVAVNQLNSPRIQKTLVGVWPDVKMIQIICTRAQLMALLLGFRLNKVPELCTHYRQAQSSRVLLDGIGGPILAQLLQHGYVIQQVYQDQVDRQIWQRLQQQLTSEQLHEIQDVQAQTGSPVGDITTRLGYLSEQAYQENLSQFTRLPVISQIIGTNILYVDTALLKQFSTRDMMDQHFFPLDWVGKDLLQVVVRNPYNSEVDFLIHQSFPNIEIVKMLGTEEDITALLAQYFRQDFSDGAVYRLLRRAPHESAARVFTLPQLLVSYCLAVGSLWLLFNYFWSALAALMTILNLFFIIAIGFKLVLSIQGLRKRKEGDRAWEKLKLRPQRLPIYTILVPVYNEPEVIPILLDALGQLDYPQEKLDVLLLLEENDKATREACRIADPPGFVRPIIIPDSHPKTKPKACNYGLAFARGQYLTIYDAEDIPDPDQLLKSLWAFKNGPPNLACVQAALNYFNREENFLTRMFTLEYSYWFDCLLPGLESFHFPIPLGGTSNHFRTDLLRELGGWDPFNVTEDADLGIRASQRGYVVGVIQSTTYEEANCQTKNWIRQRSRWIKGYMQTWLVHNRNPWRSVRTLGVKNWLAYQFFIGGTIVAFLSSPILWVLYFYWLVTRATWLVHLFPNWTLYLSLVCLLLGNALGIYLNMTAVFRRRYFKLLPYALLNPIYWQLHSMAAYMALWQLFTKPFYWEKTQHGLSKVNKQTA